LFIGCKALCRILRTNRTIRILHLDGNRFYDDCAPFFAEVFSQNEYIKYINLNKNLFENDPTGRLFGQSLAENQTIEEFHFGWNRLRAKACSYLLKPLISNARLTMLDLSWNGAGLLAAKALFELLRKNSTLEKLYLDNNQFNTECATYIGKGLAKNETLKLLTLNGNPLESSGCYAILRPLMKHPTSQLQIIDLRGIIVNKDCIDLVHELAPILPQLDIKLGREREREND
jgi:Ran GTPase-activating protein (RanGAP) involved in mRNA processing and transport